MRRENGRFFPVALAVALAVVLIATVIQGQGIKDGGVPLFVTQGDADEAVPIANTRMWVDTMKELKMDYEYKEVPGVTHGTIIGVGMPDVFAFFNRHTKPASR